MKSVMENYLTFLKETLMQIFNDFYWTPIVPQVPGLNSTMKILTSAQIQAAKLLPRLISSAVSRSKKYAGDAFAIKIGIELFNNPCAMVDAIRNFTQDQSSLPFASHLNLEDRLNAAVNSSLCFVHLYQLNFLSNVIGS